MLTDNDLDRVLDSWLATGPTRAGDGVLYEVANRIDYQRQRPAWLGQWSVDRKSAFAAALPAVAAVVLVMGVAGTVLVPLVTRLGGEPDASTPTATPLASAEPRDAVEHDCGNGAPTCNLLVEPGAHRSFVFEPSFTYSVPDAWLNPIDVKDYFELFPQAGAVTTYGKFMAMLSNVSLRDWATPCDGEFRPTGRADVQDWIDFFASQPSLLPGSPQPVTVGGAAGQRLDVSEVRISDRACQLHLTNVNQPTRILVLDVRGSIVLILIHSTMSPDPDLPAAVRTLEPFLYSLRFTEGE